MIPLDFSSVLLFEKGKIHSRVKNKEENILSVIQLTGALAEEELSDFSIKIIF
jgi:hypothetical protein